MRRCGSSACHADADGRSARPFRFRVDADGAIADNAMDDAYNTARRFIDTTEAPELSSLLRKAVPASMGGVAHAGGAAFHGVSDVAFQIVRAWIASEHDGGEDGDPATLSEGERFFAREVQPTLATNGCMIDACHGPHAATAPRFDGGAAGAFGVAVTRFNYRAARVHLSLAGNPERSRLARKPLRDLTTALPHRGGNGINAFPRTLDDPLPRAVIAWATLERRLHVGDRDDGLTGLAFVGGPVAPARVQELDGFTPGSDVFLLHPVTPDGAVQNLTARTHRAPADIRDPAVNDAGTALAFSMREGADAPRVLWEIDLRSGSARPRTHGVRLPDGRWSADAWPAYGPDGRLWFVSTRAGMLAEHADGYDTDLYVLEGDGSLTRRSSTPSPELATTVLRYGDETSGAVAFTAIRRLGDGYKGVVYRFPNDLRSEYHQHVGITLGDDITWHLREGPDGDAVALLLDRDAVWSAGALVHIDRNLGIALPRAAETSLTGYRRPVSYLGPYGAPMEALLDPYEPERAHTAIRRVESDGAWRDPQPLPDGRVVAAWAEGPVRLRDREHAPDFGLYALTLARRAGTGELSLAERTRLVDLPGVSETQPVPVFRNVPGVIPGVAPRGERGSVLHGGVPVLESMLHQVGPSGVRATRSDLRAVRILGWSPRAVDAPLQPRADLPTELRQSGAGPHLPARVLAEIPLESDGTFQASLPAGTAFRLQFLDARGMAVGTQHNRWFDVQGGQTLRQGISVAGFDARCAACHGARSGRGPDALAPAPLDVIVHPSRSLARFEGDDPERPRAPVVVDAALEASWRRTVAPALARSCAASGCHDARTHSGGLTLEPQRTARYDLAYESLVSLGEGSRHGFRYVDVTGTSARGSLLVARILGENLDAPVSMQGRGPHRGVPPLDDDGLRALVRWIEAGAAWCDDDCP